MEGSDVGRLDGPAQADPVGRRRRSIRTGRGRRLAHKHGEDVMIMPGPLYHNGPFSSAFDGLNQGAHLVIMPRFDAEDTLRTVARHRGTWMYLVPTMMSRIWRLPPEVRAQYDVTSLSTVWHLAAPCPPWLKETWIHWLGPDVIMELYGGTEGQAVTFITGEEWLAHRGSVGKVGVGEMRAVGRGGTDPATRRGSERSTCADPPTRRRPIVIWVLRRARCRTWLGIARRYRLVR